MEDANRQPPGSVGCQHREGAVRVAAEGTALSAFRLADVGSTRTEKRDQSSKSDHGGSDDAERMTGTHSKWRASASRGVHCEKPPQIGQKRARVIWATYSLREIFRRATTSVSRSYSRTTAAVRGQVTRCECAHSRQRGVRVPPALRSIRTP